MSEKAKRPASVTKKKKKNENALLLVDDFSLVTAIVKPEDSRLSVAVWTATWMLCYEIDVLFNPYLRHVNKATARIPLVKNTPRQVCGIFEESEVLLPMEYKADLALFLSDELIA